MPSRSSRPNPNSRVVAMCREPAASSSQPTPTLPPLTSDLTTSVGSAASQPSVKRKRGRPPTRTASSLRGGASLLPLPLTGTTLITIIIIISI